MSRSYRKYAGLDHSWCAEKRINHKKLRARAKDEGADASPDLRRCHKSNCYDGMMNNDDAAKYWAARRSQDYDWRRVQHQWRGK